MKIMLIGSSGKMGKEFCNVIQESKTDQIVAYVDTKNSPQNKNPDLPLFRDIPTKTSWSANAAFDIIVDFSTKQGKEDIIDCALLNKVPLAIFSTTCSGEDIDYLNKASKHIPVLHCQNTSIGINAFLNILPTLKEVFDSADIVIEEEHAKTKIDSPSGTAKLITSKIKTLTKNDVEVHPLRVGNERGSHTLKLFLEDEVLTISHRANSRKIFATGAYKMLKKLYYKKPGFYTYL